MATIIKSKGGNKTKNPKSHEDWTKGKKIGRPGQVYVVDSTTVHEGVTMTQGHWERIRLN